MSIVEALRPVVDYWYIDENGDYVYEYEPSYYDYDYDDNQDDYYDPYENDNSFEWKDTWEGLPEYDSNTLDENASWVDYLEYYRYILDIGFIGIPWTIVSVLCMGWNLWFNIAWNEVWAGGNFWLVFNTVYIMIQGIASIMLAFELPIWLRVFRGMRFWSAAAAVIYSVVYIVNIFEWYDMLYFVEDKSTYDFVTIFMNMCLGYNIVLHSTVIPINLFIVFKEISMGFFQFLKSDAGTENDDISIGWGDWNDDYELWFGE